MCRTAASEMMPLDETSEAASLAGSDDMDQLFIVEDIDHYLVAQSCGISAPKSDFPNEPHGCRVVLLEVAGHWLVDAFGLHEFNESKLHCVITMFLLGLSLNNYAGAGLDDRNGHNGAVILQQLRHTYLFAQ
jgi:hypothetical protein